ncbi:hypothetical protein [Sphingomonas antarctica]|uniref:hypothetical protein n=1 Tax=Sphingomonas antarctica TaxID=2040274 RepID=UPI0039EBA0D5
MKQPMSLLTLASMTALIGAAPVVAQTAAAIPVVEASQPSQIILRGRLNRLRANVYRGVHEGWLTRVDAERLNAEMSSTDAEFRRIKMSDARSTGTSSVALYRRMDSIDGLMEQKRQTSNSRR